MKMKRLLVAFLEFVLLTTMLEGSEGFAVERRSAASERSSDDYPDYQLGVKYDEYPMIVPKKRTALLLNRLMMALKEKMDQDNELLDNRMDYSKDYAIPPDDVRSMDLQRRGHGSLGAQQKGRVYWRCYFNAVTCF